MVLALFADVVFPMTGLKTLEVGVPKAARQTSKLRAALHQLPQLEALHVHTTNTKLAACVIDLCAELSSLSSVTSLRVSVCSCPVRLPAASLTHLTSLQLSSKASMAAPPTGLRRLCFFDLSRYAGFDELALQLQDLPNFSYLQTEIFSEDTLWQLPTTLQHLGVFKQQLHLASCKG